MRKSIIMDLSFRFSLNSIELYKKLIREKEFIISKQFLRSATSIGANVFEASAAYSRKDFTHKMTIASKEARETFYWLSLLNDSNLVKLNMDKNISDLNSIINVLSKVRSCRRP